MEPGGDDHVGYVNRIAGDFTLDKRAAGAPSVVMVGTGTGLAPFIGMIRSSTTWPGPARWHRSVRYTLFHANRTSAELAYHRELMAIEDAGIFDFRYVATVSRPAAEDRGDPRLGTGRANNVLRHVLGMPVREEEGDRGGRGRRAATSPGPAARSSAPCGPRCPRARRSRSCASSWSPRPP